MPLSPHRLENVNNEYAISATALGNKLADADGNVSVASADSASTMSQIGLANENDRYSMILKATSNDKIGNLLTNKLEFY